MATAPSTSRRPPEPAPTPSTETVADLLRRLGNIPARRVRLHPTPGTATERDVIAANASKLKTALCELVDGTLVEKPMSYEESELAVLIAYYLGAFVYPRKLGVLTGADGMMRVSEVQVRMLDVAFVARASYPGASVPGGRSPLSGRTWPSRS